MLVAVRMRPLWQKEAEAGDFSCVRVMDGKVVVVTDPWYDADLNPNRHQEKRYAFDVVFDQDVAQMDVYEKTAKGLVNGVLDGYNASVFAYGATGAGKTYTMLGSLDEPGIMFNTLHDTFERMKTEFQESKFKVTLSYVEIYNEMIKANASSAPNPHHTLTTPFLRTLPVLASGLADADFRRSQAQRGSGARDGGAGYHRVWRQLGR